VPWLNCGTAASCFPLDHLPSLRRRRIGQHWLFPVACCGPWQVQPVGALYELGVFFHATLSLHVVVTDLSNDRGCYVYAHRFNVCNMRDVPEMQPFQCCRHSCISWFINRFYCTNLVQFCRFEGHAKEEARASDARDLPAIIQGTVSTVLSILPLLWHPIPFI